MKWTTPKGVQPGERRQVQYLALLPTKLNDGYTVWLEWYWAEEAWEECAYDGYMSRWVQTDSWSKEKSQ